MSCILKNVNGARVAIVLSVKSALVITNPSKSTKTAKDCKQKCDLVEYLNHDTCIEYSIQQRINMELYVEPSTPQYTHEEFGSCFISFHGVTLRQTCWNRMEDYLSLNSQQPRIHILTKTSLLIETSGLDLELLSKSIRNYGSAWSIDACVRIQKVSHEFFSHHKAFILGTSIELTDETAIKRFTKTKIPVVYGLLRIISPLAMWTN